MCIRDSCTVCLFLAHTLIHERVLVEEVKVNENGEKINYLQVAKSFLHNRVMIAVAVSYTHLDVYKRQHSGAERMMGCSIRLTLKLSRRLTS